MKSFPQCYEVIISRLFTLAGKGGSGKTAVINLVHSFVPKGLQFNGDLTDATGRFETGFMRNKSMLYFADESNETGFTKVTRKSTFMKRVTGSDPIRYETKYGDVGYFKNTGLVFQTTNVKPPFGNSSNYASNKRRFLMLHLDKTISNENQDPEFVDKLLHAEGLQILLVAVMNIKNIDKVRRFLLDWDTESVLLQAQEHETYETQTDVFLSFLHDCFEPAAPKAGYITVKEMFALFCQYLMFRKGSTAMIENESLALQALNTYLSSNGSDQMSGYLKNVVKSCLPDTAENYDIWNCFLFRMQACLDSRASFSTKKFDLEWSRMRIQFEWIENNCTTYLRTMVVRGLQLKHVSHSLDDVEQWCVNRHSIVVLPLTPSVVEPAASAKTASTQLRCFTTSIARSWCDDYNDAVTQYEKKSAELFQPFGEELGGHASSSSPDILLRQDILKTRVTQQQLHAKQLAIESAEESECALDDNKNSLLDFMERVNSVMQPEAGRVFVEYMIESVYWQVSNDKYIWIKEGKEEKIAVFLKPVIQKCWNHFCDAEKALKTFKENVTTFLQVLQETGARLGKRTVYSMGKKKLHTLLVFDYSTLRIIMTNIQHLQTRPMIVAPLPWQYNPVMPRKGGYLLNKKLKVALCARKDAAASMCSFSWSRDYLMKLNLVQSAPFVLDLRLVPFVLNDLLVQLAAILASNLGDSYDLIRRKVISEFYKLRTILSQLALLRELAESSPNELPLLRVYQPLSVDRNGRMYRQGLLNITNSKFMRTLLITESSIKCKLEQQVELPPAQLPLDTDVLSKNYILKCHDRRSYYKKNTLRFHDATSSMMQIYACLFGDFILAEYANLGASAYNDTVFCLLKKWSSEVKLSPESENVLKNRKVLKMFLMLRIYGASYITLQAEAELFLKLKNKAYLNAALRFLWEKSGDSFAPLITLKDKAYNHGKVRLKWQGNEVEYCYHSKITKRFGYTDIITKKEVIFSLELLDASRVDKRKTKRTVMSAVLHSLDAAVALNVCYELRKKNIDVHAIHDSFCCSDEHVELLKKTYKKMLYKYVFCKNPYALLNIENLVFEKDTERWKAIWNCASDYCLKRE